jgi:hypothetical protein
MHGLKAIQQCLLVCRLVCWAVNPSSLVDIFQDFGGNGFSWFSSFVAISHDLLVCLKREEHLYQTTRRHIPENSNLKATAIKTFNPA